MPSTTTAASVGDLRTLLPSWHIHLAAENKSPRTIQSYAEAARQFVAFLTAAGMPTEAANVRREHIEAFIADLLTRYSSNTAANRYRSLQQLFRWLEDDGEIPLSPMHKMKPPKLAERVIPVVTEDHVKALFAGCASKSFDDLRDRAILSVLIDTGLRLSELTDIKLDDIDWATKRVAVIGKGNRGRWVGLGKSTMKDLDRYRRVRAGSRFADEAWLWLGRKGRLTTTGIQQMLRRRCAAAGVPALHPHQFRHTFAHLMKVAGVSDEEIMAIGGWRDQTMLRRYGASAVTERALETHQRVSPRDRF